MHPKEEKKKQQANPRVRAKLRTGNQELCVTVTTTSKRVYLKDGEKNYNWRYFTKLMKSENKNGEIFVVSRCHMKLYMGFEFEMYSISAHF